MNDILVGETGTSVFGLCDFAVPATAQFISRIYYGHGRDAGIETARKELQGWELR